MGIHFESIFDRLSLSPEPVQPGQLLDFQPVNRTSRPSNVIDHGSERHTVLQKGVSASSFPAHLIRPGNCTSIHLLQVTRSIEDLSTIPTWPTIQNQQRFSKRPQAKRGVATGEEFAPLLSLSIRYHVTGSVWELDRQPPSLLLPGPAHSVVIYPYPAVHPFASLDDEDDDNNNIELLLLRTTTYFSLRLFPVVPTSTR